MKESPMDAVKSSLSFEEFSENFIEKDVTTFSLT